ncbi:hypothetical protein LO772_29685 [Yinghuangia sp. ASG 101]|uniref:hypothetical protein n=1 Tax=Yinghuangia sp. ASG 101 TaxID=2896848 RepID=UPI001E3D3E5A|nr:hypothetical protein [Yinghuangia sp. ASG 101]UGQ10940.1 hypothetical protein LO772_29685 [Yinghuangia sp. ASG 101]
MPDISITRTSPHSLYAHLHTRDSRLDLLHAYGFDVAGNAEWAVLHTSDALLLPTARRLVAELHIAGLDVAAEAGLAPSRPEIESARRVAMTKALARANDALHTWDTESESLCDERGWPLDGESYGQRRAELDRAAWEAFTTFLTHGLPLLEQAERTRERLSGDHEQAAGYILSRMRASLTRGVIVHADAERVLAYLRNADGTPTDEAAYAHAVETRNSEGWHAAYEWMLHGEALVTLAAAGAEVPTPLDAAPSLGGAAAVTSEAAPGRRSTGRR